MRLGGWSRLGVVAAIIYGLLIVFIAYEGYPRLAQLESDWVDEAAEVIADAITKAEGKDVATYRVREAVLRQAGGKPTLWLEEVESSPSENQKRFSTAVAGVNKKHREMIAALPNRQQEYWLIALACWVGGISLFLLSIWTARWVYCGFRHNST